MRRGVVNGFAKLSITSVRSGTIHGIFKLESNKQKLKISTTTCNTHNTKVKEPAAATRTLDKIYTPNAVVAAKTFASTE